MRKGLLRAAVMLLMAGALASTLAERPRIILYTAYRQVGWGDAVQIGCVDESGGLWAVRGYDSDLKWPYGWEKQIEYLQATERLSEAGTLTHDELFALKSLIAGVSATEDKPVGWMCDAGTESSRAVRYDREGKAEAILLGMTGDDLLENTDPNAQALYLKLRFLFPFVRCYAGEGTQEWGFQPVSIAAFCHLDEINWDDVRVSAWYTDCEAGPQQRDLTEDEEKRIFDCVKTGFVIGKENAFGVTGSTTMFFFSDRDGKVLGSIELYNSLLVRSDGMYQLTSFSF